MIKKIWIFIIILVVISTVSTSFFIYKLFEYSTTPPRKQPFFVNCTYYIYPNGTFAVVNVTLVIPLGKIKPVLENHSNSQDIYFIWTPPSGKFLDKNNDGMLSVGDKYYIHINKKFYVSLNYCGLDADGKYWVAGELWDSVHGSYIWEN